MEVVLDKIIAEQKEIRRLVEHVLSVVDRIYKDREVTVETHESLIGVKERLIADRQHNDTLLQDVKADVGNVAAKVEKIDNNTVVVKLDRKTMLMKIRNMFKGGDKK